MGGHSDHTSSGVKFRYVPALDGLRAVAILAVMGLHFAPHVITAGSLGVDIFFVLSGYLITSILLNEIETTGALDYRAFLIRRVRRLLPALGALLAIYSVAGPLLFPEVAGRRWFDIATAAFYMTNLRQTFWPANTPLSHTWSLAIEEQFYLLWPFLLLWLVRFPRERVTSWLLCSWLALTLVRTTWEVAIGGAASYYFTPFHATGLIVGAIVALKPPTLRVGRRAFALLLLLIVAGMARVTYLIPQAVAEICAALVIVDPPAVLSLPSMRFLGRISYGVYLWHIPLLWLLGDSLKARFGVIPGIEAIAAISCLAGWLSYVLVERHFLRTSGNASAKRELAVSV